MILSYKGKVDEWRVLRDGFNLIHSSLVEKRADILQAIPLPFDSEIRESEKVNVDQMIADYYMLQNAGVFNA